MCGIAGKIDLARPVDGDLVNRMCEMIEHRGPDGRGVHLSGGVGLGIQRLAVIDLHTGDQPIYNEDRSVVVVLNGEIYNYLELREGLIARGHTLATSGDTEVIVHLYEELGEACVGELRGMFAFALWDERRGRLLVARDRLGKKPLFYRATDRALWFASEPRSILQDPEVPRTPDWTAIDSYLRYQYVPHPRSAFGAVRKLPPAHTMTWSGGAPALKRYWRLHYEPGEHRSLVEATEMVRESLLEATRIRLRADVPVGAFLSGGVDSSAVVAAMAMSGPARVKTFSIGFDHADYDETAYARQVAQRYDTDHHEFRVEPDAISVLPKLVWHYGEPFADSSALPSFYLAQLTRRHVTVALNGDGGDEGFAGYMRYLAAAYTSRVDLLPRALRASIARAAARVGSGRGSRTLRSRSVRALTAVAARPWDRYDQFVSNFHRGDLDELYEPGFIAGLPEPNPNDAWISSHWKGSQAASLVDTLLDVDVQTYLPGDLLVKMDIATMAHSLEVRSPLLDHVFMERVARLPGSLKLRGRELKVVLKEAVRPWLPDAVIDRPKMGFGVPLASWFRGGLGHLPEDILLDPAATSRGIFQPAEVSRLIAEHRSGARDHASRLWALMMLELWLETYVDAPSGQSRPMSLSAG
jgi:asparagine synthase (glutamine-hydrolysing)